MPVSFALDGYLAIFRVGAFLLRSRMFESSHETSLRRRHETVCLRPKVARDIPFERPPPCCVQTVKPSPIYRDRRSHLCAGCDTIMNVSATDEVVRDYLAGVSERMMRRVGQELSLYLPSLTVKSLSFFCNLYLESLS